MIIFAATVPHPPLSIPGVGNEDDLSHVRKTILVLEKLGRSLEVLKPDTIAIISPHAKMEPYNFVINSDPDLRGGLGDFGVDWVINFKNDIGLIDKIAYACDMNEIPLHFHASFLDHGALVPLYHMAGKWKKKPSLIHLSFSLFDYEKHYDYGRLLGGIFNSTDKRIAIIASGDLSHRLRKDSPAGYNPRAKVFDRRVIELIAEDDLDSIFKFNKDFAEDAAECGLRSFLIMLGSISLDKRSSFKLLCYECPFGVGYMTARFI